MDTNLLLAPARLALVVYAVYEGMCLVRSEPSTKTQITHLEPSCNATGILSSNKKSFSAKTVRQNKLLCTKLAILAASYKNGR